MARLPLNSGAYSSASLILSAQRCVNLYPEVAPEAITPPAPVVHNLAPGLKQILQLPDVQEVRCVYTATNGDLYACCGPSIYWIQQSGSPGAYTYTPYKCGTLASTSGLVRMADNGNNILIADGTAGGYTISMNNHAMNGISAAHNAGSNGFAFYGMNWVDFQDTFLFGNAVGTAGWFASGSNNLLFDSLSFGSKSGLTDTLLATVALKRNIWLIGTLSTELWYNAGNTNFPFALLSGPYIESGAVGPWAIARSGSAVVWLSQNRIGKGIVLLGQDYSAQRISTYALESEFQTYGDLSTVRAFSWQTQGHSFVAFRFPNVDKTWVVDVNTLQWHERETMDASGNPHMWRANCATEALGVVWAGDYANGNLYQIDPGTLTDNGMPIQRLRSFPHFVNELKRASDWQFLADMETGNATGPVLPPVRLFYDLSNAFGPLQTETGVNILLDPYKLVYPQNFPLVNLRYSNTRGKSWGPYIQRSLGAIGQYQLLVRWGRLGLARDRVYELSWSAPQITSLMGAFVSRDGKMS